MRKARIVTNPEDIKYLLELTEERCLEKSFITEAFGEYKGSPRFYPYDIVTIPPNSYGPEGKRNKNSFRTTVGLWVFNKAFVEKDLFDIFHYVNDTFGKKMAKKFKTKISEAILEDRLSLEAFKTYIKKLNKFMPYATFLSASYTMKMLTVTKIVEAKKNELVKKYRKELDAGDTHVAQKIQDELLELAEETLKDDPSMDMFKSDAVGDIGNNFKNMFIMKGIIKDPDPNKGYNIVMSSYMDGIKSEDYVAMANSLAAGPYARAKKTALGGYWEKLLLVAYQHLTITAQDCHTKRTVEITLTDDNIGANKYNFIVDNGKLVELTSENIPKYLGKKVKMRFSSLCEQKNGLCQVCAGDLFKGLGVVNIGTSLPQVASKLKNISMKSFHDSQVVRTKINYMEAFGLNEKD